jgi:hypothetical protein
MTKEAGMAEAEASLPVTNGGAIEAEIAWFTALLDRRFRVHGGELEDEDVLAALPPPPLAAATPYGEAAQSLSPGERLVLILAILPLLRPQALDPLLIPNSQAGRPFTEFGGAPAGNRSGFQPTRETALFLIAGEGMDRRLAAMALFDPDSPLHARRILDLPSEPGEPGPWTPLLVNPAWLGRLTTGRKAMPRFGPDFPAREISTAYEWDDLVLPEEVREEIEDLVAWVENEAKLMDEWGLGKHLKPGYRALFHGPPGTGKTVTAAVLGKKLGRPVYRVDLSRVTSKWIGETEKNLASLFDHAAEGDMILFFDEADALFGKRGDTRSANDRHSNQQIAYLLQRIEDCPGVVILASNLKGNIDSAFARRFQATVHFPMPDAEARLKLWRRFLRPDDLAARHLDLPALARRYELSGGNISNAVRHAATRASAGGAMDAAGLAFAAERELRKERYGGA